VKPLRGKRETENDPLFQRAHEEGRELLKLIKVTAGEGPILPILTIFHCVRGDSSVEWVSCERSWRVKGGAAPGSGSGCL